MDKDKSITSSPAYPRGGACLRGQGGNQFLLASSHHLQPSLPSSGVTVLPTAPSGLPHPHPLPLPFNHWTTREVLDGLKGFSFILSEQ